MQAIAPMMVVGGIGGFILAMVTIFKKEWSPITAPIYALLEGLLLGGVSAMLEMRFHGIAIQAVALTFGTLVAMLVAYRTGLIKVTDKLRLGIVAATGGIAVFYFLQFILGFFGVHFTSINGGRPDRHRLQHRGRDRRRAESCARLRPDREWCAHGRSEVHGVVWRLRADDHADLALLRDPAAAVEVPQPKLTAVSSGTVDSGAPANGCGHYVAGHALTAGRYHTWLATCR